MTVDVTVLDGHNDPVPGTIEVEVRAAEEKPPPVARADSYSLKAGEPGSFPVLENDEPREGLTFVGSPERLQGRGALPQVGCGGTCITYDSAPDDFLAPVRIRYTVTDGRAPEGQSPTSARQVTADVTITVWGRPGKPVGVSGEVRSGGVLVSWQKNAAGNGLPVDGYLVEVESPDGGRVAGTDPPSGRDGAQRDRPPERAQLPLPGGGPEPRVRTGRPCPRELERLVAALPTRCGSTAPVAVQARFDQSNNKGGAGGVLQVSWQAPPGHEGSEITEYVRCTPTTAAPGGACLRRRRPCPWKT